MDVPSRPLGEPVSDSLGLVGGYVVHDDVDVEVAENAGFDDVQEGAELARPIASEAFADDRAGGGVKSREQAERSVAGIIVSAPLDLTDAQRQKRLGAVERLNLALFVDAENHRALEPRQVEADDVASLFDEPRIGRQLEDLGAVQLKVEGFPYLPAPLLSARSRCDRTGAVAPARTQIFLTVSWDLRNA